MADPNTGSHIETGVAASRSLRVIIGKLLVVESESLSYDTRRRPVQGTRRALISQKNQDGQGRSVIVAEYKESRVAHIADLISQETTATGPFTGHVEYDIRNGSVAASGVVYTRQNEGPVVLFSRSLDPANPHSQDSREAFDFTRMVGSGLLWAELLYDPETHASIEREPDEITLIGLKQFLSNYLPAEAG